MSKLRNSSTNIQPELSFKNKYHLNKHRFYELKHYCLQYPFWKTCLQELTEAPAVIAIRDPIRKSDIPDPVHNLVELRDAYSRNIELVERVASMAEPSLERYLLKAVTEDLPFAYLKTMMDIPCERDMYYDRYRRFFWLLSKEKGI